MTEGSGCGRSPIADPEAEGSNLRVRELERALEECREANETARKELDLLCYAISHDLRAPLRAIDGFSEALLEDCSEQVGEDGRQYLGRLRSASQRMVQMIDGLLDLSRLARAPLEREQVDLSMIARTLIDDLVRRDAGRKARVTVREGVVAQGDSRLLRVLLETLLDNAWKFTARRSEPSVEFGAAQADEGMVYFVRDDGAGFDMKFAAKLFAPFQRLHAPSEFEGLGMGLARARRIVQRHGGRIWAQAAADGGRRFLSRCRGRPRKRDARMQAVCTGRCSVGGSA